MPATSELCADIGRFHVDPAATELDAALLVNRFLDDTVDTADIRAQLDGLARETAGPPWEALAEAGFGGDPGYDLEQGSRLDRVLENRRGLPITLGVLLIHVSRQCALAATGINFPGHFLVRVGERLIDPFLLRPTTEANCLAQLGGADPGGDPFAAAGPSAILLRMFNNLKGAFAARGEFHRCLDALECQLAVLPADPSLNYEKGEFWLRLGSVSAARAAFERVLDGPQAAAGEIAELARRRLVSLTGRDETLH